MKINKVLTIWALSGIFIGFALSLFLILEINRPESGIPSSLSESISQKTTLKKNSSAPTLIKIINHDQIAEKIQNNKISNPENAFIETLTERIPNFAQKYTAINLSNGEWSNPNVWRNNHVPQNGDIVRIAKNTKVVYDIASDIRIKSIGIAGQLDFSTNETTRLRVTNLLIYPDGRLQVGTNDDPVNSEFTAEIIFNDQPLDTGIVETPGTDPSQYANGILTWGTLTLHGTSIAPTFLRLAEEPKKGSRKLVLSTTPEGWRAGDRILIPDSRQILTGDIERVDGKPYKSKGSRGIVVEPMWEIAKIAQINGNKLQLSNPIRFQHPGAKDLSGSPVLLKTGEALLPHIANITRNIIIRSENPEGTRGHTISFRNATVHIANTLFRNLGRTTIEKLDNTVIDTNNSVIKIGTNQIARYPIHMHHQTDPMRVTGTRYEYNLTGNVVETAPRWGIVIHSTHFGLVKDNVVFDAAGAGIATEDGSETGNRFEHNFITGIRGSGQPINSRSSAEGLGHEGSGFWLGSDNNTLLNNVVAGVRDSGFTLFRSKSSKSYPEFPNLDLTSPNKSSFKNQGLWFKFQSNEVYSSAGNGIELWDDKKRDVSNAGVSTLDKTIVWHSRNGINFDYHADHYEINGLTVLVDNEKSDGTSGVLANFSKRAVIKNANIKFVETGIEGGGSRNRQLIIENTDILAKTGIRIFRGSSWGKRHPLQIINTKISLLVSSSQSESGKLIDLQTGSNYKRSAKPVIHRPIQVRQFQGKIGQNFQIYYPDQSPDFVIDKNKDKFKGCPESGLTNKQCLSKFGIAMGGELASCNQSIPGIDGFSCPDE